MGVLEGILYMMWRGIAIGIIISAPMGPVGILCIQRTLEKGRLTGLYTGVGAAISDLFYCLLTGFGLSLIEDFLKTNQNIIQIIGSVVLVVFGIYLFKSNPARSLKKPEELKVSPRKNILSGFLFTFSNPLIIFLIIGLFARFNFLLPEIKFYHYITGFIFIFVGALLWWWIVTLFVDKVRAHFNLRSMWLVNKIIGCVVMIFAVVGIATAISGMASASGRHPVYLNSLRGFGSADSTLGKGSDFVGLDNSEAFPRSGRGGPLVLENTGSDTLYTFLPLHKAEEFSLSFRLANLNNRPGKRYPYGEGHAKGSATHPGWVVAVKGPGAWVDRFTVTTINDIYDELVPSRLRISAESGENATCENDFTDGFSFFTDQNAWRVEGTPGKLTLSGGNRLYRPVATLTTESEPYDSIGFGIAPGGKVAIDWLELTVSETPDASDTGWLGNPDVINTLLSRSRDDMEGIWEMFDYTFDDASLRPGGKYTVAILRGEEGYDIIYLAGAEKNPDLWRPGMKKGRLTATPFKEVWNVEWLDPSRHPLPGEIKAQPGDGHTLTVTFPAHNSRMRLRRTARTTWEAPGR